jgi:hypothetical protein
LARVQVLGNCIIPIIVFIVATTLVLAASLSFASLSRAQASDERPLANDFARQIIDSELQAEKNDHSHWMLRLETRKSGKTEVREAVRQCPICSITRWVQYTEISFKTEKTVSGPCRPPIKLRK